MGDTDRDRPGDDRLAPARGILRAVILGLLLWLGIGAIVYLLLR